MEYINDTVIPTYVVPAINANLQETCSQLSMQAFLDPQNLTAIKYSLTSPPQFGVNGIIVDLNGGAFAVNKRNNCPLPSPPVMDSHQGENFQIYISEYVVNCGLLAFQESGQFSNIFNSYIQQYLHPDKRFSMTFNVSSTFAMIAPTGITMDLGLQLSALMFSSTGPFITIALNESIATQISLNTSSPNITVQIEILNAFTFFGDVTTNHFPAIYEEQIENTNFTLLAQEADQFVATNVLPALNSGLAVPLPSFVVNYLVNPQLSLFENMLFITTNLRNPEMYHIRIN